MSVTRSESKFNSFAKELYQADLDFAAVTPVYITELSQRIVNATRETYNQICTLRERFDNICFSTLMQPLIDLEILTSKASKFCTFLLLVHPDKDTRLASEEIERLLSKTKVEMDQREDVCQVFLYYFTHQFKNEKEVLSPEQLRYCQTLEKYYLRNGLFITDKDKKNKLASIKNQLTELSSQFESNIRNVNTFLTFTKDELAGVPAFWFSKEKEIASGIFKVTLDYPDYFPVVESAKNRDTRKKIYIAYHTRCVNENLPLLERMVLLRHELAILLGYDTYVDYMAENRMTKNAKTIDNFLENLFKVSQKSFIEHTHKVTQFAKEIENDSTFILQNYDIAFYNQLYIEKKLQLNMEEFNSYFNLDHVLKATFQIYEELLSLSIKETQNKNKWHPEVKTFEVYDKDKKLGEFYLDLFPREGKYNHFAAFDIIPPADISHLTEDNKEVRQLPSIAMVCNFSRQGTMAFEPEVITFFHEFGHVMHYLCATNKLPKFHSFGAETDFIEAPSQMLENWCYDYRILKMISSHPQTGEPLPESMAYKLNELRILNNIFVNMRQLALSRYDFDIHFKPTEILGNSNLKLHFQNILKKLRNPINPVPEECFPAAFLHISGGMESISYAAGYYGYLLSMTYAADMFNTKFKDNPLDKQEGMFYRKTLLEKGATEDGLQMITKFLGHEPSLEAFKQNYGLNSHASTSSSLKQFGFLQPRADTEEVLNKSPSLQA